MIAVKNLVPSTKIKDWMYPNLPERLGLPSSLEVIVRYNDDDMHPDIPTKEKFFQNLLQEFNGLAFLEELQNLTAYVMTENGIFYAKKEKGLFFLYDSGNTFRISEQKDIYSMSLKDDILTVYFYKDMKKTQSYVHRDVCGGLAEEWYDTYSIIDDTCQYQYEKILQIVWERRKQNNTMEENFIDGIDTAYTGICTCIKPDLFSKKANNREEICYVPDGITEMHVFELQMDQRKVGYRIKSNQGVYDVDIETAEKFGFDQIIAEKKISVQRIYGWILSPYEIKNHKFFKDISRFDGDCKKLIQCWKQLNLNKTDLLSSGEKEMEMQYEDNEDCFGFHSEYYIDDNWHMGDPDECNLDSTMMCETIVKKGYTRYSKYGEDIYFLPDWGENKYIVKCNVSRKQAEMIKLDTKKGFGYGEYYIAVNRQGYFIYNTIEITLFGFDGHKIYTHKFGQKNYVESIYIYDQYVVYSETKKTNITSKIWRVDMLTQKQEALWSTMKGDDGFDHMLKECYREVWKNEMPFFNTPSNVGNVTCAFLYMNAKRVIAGYTRSKAPNFISYIINIDLATGHSNLLECFLSGWYEKKELPSKHANCIFAFDMLCDCMWMKTDDQDIRLMKTPIQKKKDVAVPYKAEWKIPQKKSYKGLYYLDGKRGYIPTNMCVYGFSRDGETKRTLYHDYQTEYFWGVGDLFTITDFYNTNSFYDEDGSCVYSLDGQERNALIKQAEEILPLTAMEIEPRKKVQKTTGNEETTAFDTMTIVELRALFQECADYSEQLKGFRKELKDDKWDYNVVMGILLGSCKRHATGPRHVQEQNAGIGQGDNKDMVVVTLNQYDMMDIYLKYEKISDSDVEVSEAIKDICEKTPKLRSICDKIRTILQ